MAVAASAGKAPAPLVALPEMLARDTIIAWYRGEFAAANAIIDVLCSHIVQITRDPSEYESVFTAIHRRRMNWIPVLHMQRYFSIADVASELRRVASSHKDANLNADGSDCANVTVKEDIKDSSEEERAPGGISEGTRVEYSSVDSSDRKVSEDDTCPSEGGSCRLRPW